MRIVMMGTGPFAVPAFKSLVQSSHEVLLLVTRPIAAPGKRRKSPPNPMRDAAEQLGLQVVSPASANDSEFIAQLELLNADLLVVCDYGQILSDACLAVTRQGGINLHASLLPKYRGAAPINWAIYHGEKQTGVTVIHMSPKLDAGNSLVQLSTPITGNENAMELEHRLSELGVTPVLEAIEVLEKWDHIQPIGEMQDQDKVTRARRLRKDDGEIDWNRTASQICNQILAFQPWPGTFSTWFSQGAAKLRLIFHSAETIVASQDHSPPGLIVHRDKTSLHIGCGADILVPTEVQVPGKKRMPVADFLRGHALLVGDTFASP